MALKRKCSRNVLHLLNVMFLLQGDAVIMAALCARITFLFAACYSCAVYTCMGLFVCFYLGYVLFWLDPFIADMSLPAQYPCPCHCGCHCLRDALHNGLVKFFRIRALRRLLSVRLSVCPSLSLSIS